MSVYNLRKGKWDAHSQLIESGHQFRGERLLSRISFLHVCRQESIKTSRWSNKSIYQSLLATNRCESGSAGEQVDSWRLGPFNFKNEAVSDVSIGAGVLEKEGKRERQETTSERASRRNKVRAMLKTTTVHILSGNRELQ